LAIRLEKKYHLEIEQREVWNAIQDPDILAEILPNCTALESVGNNKYTAHIDVKIGPLSSKFQSTLEMFDIQEPNGYKFRVRGNGIKGTMDGQGEIQLHSNGDGTSFTFIAEGKVTGIIARVGQRLIEATGKKLMDQGFENFKTRIMGTAAA